MVTATQSRKRALRSLNNVAGKLVKAEDRRKADIELGKTVIVTEVDGVKKYAFPPKQKIKEQPSQPRSAFVSAKKYRQADPRKGRSGHKPEHTQALAEDASRTFANEVTKALVVPAVDGTPVTIGEFADHDPLQGAAIDNSVATGENLFA